MKKLPLDYRTGSSPFLNYEFQVDPRVFCPRPETEGLLLLAETHLTFPFRGWLLDAGTGSGCLGISFLLRHPEAKVLLCDIQRKALEVAQKNAEHLLPSLSPITFLQGDLCTPLFQVSSFTAILCNPPYIAHSEWLLMDPEVFAEPQMAWDGGEDGLSFFRPFIPLAHQVLSPCGKLFLECGFAQAEKIAELCTPRFRKIEIAPDLASTPRYIVAEK